LEAAKILFDKLTLEYIREEMIGKQFENSYLECKQKSRSERSETDQSDESNYAKALSGFANTSGGILIFGLKADKENDVDSINAITPITNVNKFESRLRELESRIVERPINGVEYRSILTSGEEGILAVYIPQSVWLPHRSTKDSKFYIRAGGTFQSIDLNLVEDLFFRRRFRPKLELSIHVRDRNNIIISIVNSGQACAKNPYIIIKLPPTVGVSGYELDGNTHLTSFVRLNQYRGENGHFLSFAKGMNMVIHPDSEIPLLCLQTGSSTTAPHCIQYFIYAEDIPVFNGESQFVA
jgi:hypothetical protein